MMMNSNLIVNFLALMCSTMVFAQTIELLGREPKIFNADVNSICVFDGTLRAQDIDGNDPQFVFCGDNLSVGRSPSRPDDLDGAAIDLRGGQDTIVSTGFCRIGDSIPGNVSMGDGKDTIKCGDMLVMSFNGAVNLGNGDDFISVQDGGCNIDGTLEAGSGVDMIICSTSSGHALVVNHGTLDLGNGRDVINAETESIGDEACEISNGGSLSGGKGADTLNCNGGNIGLRVTGTNSTLDMGDGADQIYSENDIVIEFGGQFKLGNGSDIVRTDGCLRGTVEMGNGADSIFAMAASGKIIGGNGQDCYHPTMSGNYTLTCAEGVTTLTAPNGTTCNGANAMVTLESVERIGCAEDSGFIPVPLCAGDYTTAFPFPQ